MDIFGINEKIRTNLLGYSSLWRQKANQKLFFKRKHVIFYDRWHLRTLYKPQKKESFKRPPEVKTKPS